MRRGWLAVLMIGFSGCTVISGSAPPDGDSAPGREAAATTGTEVLIVSQPSGAKILLGDAELGATPMTIKITVQTTLILELPGYTRQAVLLSPDSKPNMVVDLIPAPPAQGALVEPPAVPTRQPTMASSKPRAARSSRSASDRHEALSSAAPKEQLAPPPAPPPSSVTPPPLLPSNSAAKSSRKFNTMRQVKEALSKGEIDRQGYKEAQADIRRRIREETDKLKKQYRDKKLTKDEYEKQVRAVKIKYEG